MEIICSSCQSVINSDSEFCPHCLSFVSLKEQKAEQGQNICPICGNENDVQDRKCKNCCSII